MGTKNKLLLCNCETTMALDEAGLAEALGTRLAAPLCSQLCKGERHLFQKALQETDKEAGGLSIACTQQVPLFELIRDELAPDAEVQFFNIRELAGWSDESKEVLPKILSLVARADAAPVPTRSRDILSDGMCLIYGEGDAAFEIAGLLCAHVPVAILLKEPGDALPFLKGDIPIARGVIERVRGSLGAFDIVVRDYAPVRVSSRDHLQFDDPEPKHSATASTILDLTHSSGIYAPTAAPEGYFRCAPEAKDQLYKMVLEIIHFKGTFEKPLYVNYRESLCAHGANGITACTKCLDNCPLGAVQSIGDRVAFDAALCEGCGACAALCPTGAVSYDYPSFADLVKQVDAMAGAYFGRGGENPELLLSATSHGGGIMEALARFGKGLPARVVPFDLHQVSVVDHVLLLMALARGYSRIHLLIDEAFSHEAAALSHEVELALGLYSALYPGRDQPITMIVTNDPSKLETALWRHEPVAGLAPRRLFLEGEKRQILGLVMASLLERSDYKGEVVPLSPGAPYGEIEVDRSACTLCLACVSACPTSALGDHPERPQLSFKEISCVQCGLCRKTCPEDAIKLKPQYSLTRAALTERVMKKEEPFHCIRCGVGFGVKSTIDKITEKLSARHWMFETEDQVDLIKMCDQCRVIHLAEQQQKGAGKRPRPKTTDDYIDEEEG